MANEFEYVNSFRDKHNRIVYECRCAVCGAQCYYYRAGRGKPICVDCRAQRAVDLANGRKRQRIVDSYAAGRLDERFDLIAELEMKILDLMCCNNPKIGNYIKVNELMNWLEGLKE